MNLSFSRRETQHNTVSCTHACGRPTGNTFCFSLLPGDTETTLQESIESALNEVSSFRKTASYREYRIYK